MACLSLIIAIEKYPDLATDLGKELPGTLDAAGNFRNWLIEKKGLKPEDILFCASPAVEGISNFGGERADIEQAIVKLRKLAEADSIEEFYFFFSGHGYSQVDPQNSTSATCLLAADYVNQDTGRAAIDHQELVDFLCANLGPGTHFHFVDACRQKLDPADFPVSTLGIARRKAVTGEARAHVLFSTKVGTRAKVNSRFAAALMEGLVGMGRAKRWVTDPEPFLAVEFESLERYVDGRMSPQKPEIGTDDDGLARIYVLPKPWPKHRCKISVAGARADHHFNVHVSNLLGQPIDNPMAFSGGSYEFFEYPEDYKIALVSELGVSPKELKVDLYNDEAEAKFSLLGAGEPMAVEPRVAKVEVAADSPVLSPPRENVGWKRFVLPFGAVSAVLLGLVALTSLFSKERMASSEKPVGRSEINWVVGESNEVSPTSPPPPREDTWTSATRIRNTKVGIGARSGIVKDPQSSMEWRQFNEALKALQESRGMSPNALGEDPPWAWSEVDDILGEVVAPPRDLAKEAAAAADKAAADKAAADKAAADKAAADKAAADKAAADKAAADKAAADKAAADKAAADKAAAESRRGWILILAVTCGLAAWWVARWKKRQQAENEITPSSDGPVEQQLPAEPSLEVELARLCSHLSKQGKYLPSPELIAGNVPFTIAMLGATSLTAMPEVSAGKSILSVVIGLRSQIAHLCVGFSSPDDPENVTWEDAVKLEGAKLVSQNVWGSAAGQVLVSIAFGKVSVITLAATLIPGRVTSITISEASKGPLRVRQLILPLSQEDSSSQEVATLREKIDAQRDFDRRGDFKRSDLMNWVGLAENSESKEPDPLMGLLACYHMIRTGQKQDLEPALENLTNYFPELPDLPALRRLAKEDGTKTYGLPIFLKGLDAFRNESGNLESLPLLEERLDYGSFWTLWRGALPPP